MRLATLRSVFVAVGSLLIATACQAGTVTATASFANFNDVIININKGGGASDPLVAFGRAGYLVWTQTDPVNPQFPTSFKSFCIELTQQVLNGGVYTYTTAALESAPAAGTPNPPPTVGGGSGMGQPKADALRLLWGSAYSSNFSNRDAAAFQLAIWRLEYDLGNPNITDFSTGNFRASVNSSDVADSTYAIGKAQEFLTNVFNGTYTTSEMGLIAFTNPTVQDQIGVAPEPSSLCLGGVAAVTLIGARFVRRKKTSGNNSPAK